MRSRLAVVVAFGGKTRPPFGKLAKDLMTRPMSPAFSMVLKVNSIASDWAMVSVSPARSGKELVFGLMMKAARVTRGSISFTIASHFPAILPSYRVRPVRLLRGRARLTMKPARIGAANSDEYYRNVSTLSSESGSKWCTLRHDHIGTQRK